MKIDLRKNRCRNADLIEMKMIAQFAQMIDIHHLATEFDAVLRTHKIYWVDTKAHLKDCSLYVPDKRLEKLPHDSDKIGRMYKIKGLEIFLVLPIECPIRLKQPPERRLILTVEAVMEIHNAIILFDKLIKCEHQVSVVGPH